MPIARRVGRPGLIATAARTAVIAGTAQATAGAVAQRQQRSAAAAAQPSAATPPPEQAPAAAVPPPVPAAAAAAGPNDELLAQLERLTALHTAGVLSDEEFTAGKAKLLA